MSKSIASNENSCQKSNTKVTSVSNSGGGGIMVLEVEVVGESIIGCDRLLTRLLLETRDRR